MAPVLHENVPHIINTLRPRQNGRHFPDDVYKCIFLNENVWISIKTSLKYLPKGPINNIPALVQIMAWRRPGDKPLYEPMMVRLPTHICVTRSQWVKLCALGHSNWNTAYIGQTSQVPNDMWNVGTTICNQTSTLELLQIFKIGRQ